jgi:hypothetical protein
MLLMVSPRWTVYVKGVGVGSGVSAATRPSGVEVVSIGAIESRVEVAKGMRVEGKEVEVPACDVQEARRKHALSSVEVRKEKRRKREADRREQPMRRL